MTTVLWDGKVLAADSRNVKHDKAYRDTMLKLYSFSEQGLVFKGHTVLAIAIAGGCPQAQRAVDTFCKHPDTIVAYYREIYESAMHSTASFALLIVTDGPTYQLDVGRSRAKIPVELQEITTLPHAMGSGGTIAHFLSAQYHVPAHLAVAGAVMGDRFSGGFIYAIGIKKGKVVTQERHWYPDAAEIRNEIAKAMRVPRQSKKQLIDDPHFVQITLPSEKEHP